MGASKGGREVGLGGGGVAKEMLQRWTRPREAMRRPLSQPDRHSGIRSEARRHNQGRLVVHPGVAGEEGGVESAQFTLISRNLSLKGKTKRSRPHVDCSDNKQCMLAWSLAYTAGEFDATHRPMSNSLPLSRSKNGGSSSSGGSTHEQLIIAKKGLRS